MTSSGMISRRTFAGAVSSIPLAACLPSLAIAGLPRGNRDRILGFIARHRKATGGYGWLSRTRAHITPTFAAVGCHRLLQSTIPDREALASFVRSHYPVPEGLSQQPLWRLDYEQAQILSWLGKPFDMDKLGLLKEPLVYNSYFEQNGYPTLQHQAMAVRLKKMLDMKQPEVAWEQYFKLRRRSNGTFNNSLASDGSGGHVVNTLWGLQALDDLGEPEPLSADGVAWIRRCQLATGGFTWSPSPELGRCENMIYTWAAVSLLARENMQPRDGDGCIRWISDQFTEDGGFRSSPLAYPNLTATYYALDTLRILGVSVADKVRPRPTHKEKTLPSTLKIYSAQIEAPGYGSPAEAVELARKLRINLWMAKNASSEWIAQAQMIARASGASVNFARGDEEYGTYTSVPGLGTYSHLNDLVAPGDAKLGAYPPEKDVSLPWTDFRDTRIKNIREKKGRMVWQFNENEELTRILLDEASSTGDYSAISSFHFGRDDFLDFEPFLMEWEGRIGMIGLQDAHGGESWWWANELQGFRTLYLAEDPSWDSFVKAVDKRWILSVRRDASTNNAIEWSGASSEVRKFIAEREHQWAWWSDGASTLPLAILSVIRPNMPFEIAAPSEGVNIRVRLRYGLGDSPNKAQLVEQQSELVYMEVDGEKVVAKEVILDHDRYLIHNVKNPRAKIATVMVRDLKSNRTEILSAELV